jgi:hypothetical protein
MPLYSLGIEKKKLISLADKTFGVINFAIHFMFEYFYSSLGNSSR